jgi:predicted O-linked N-acetylglucosamine transferase (SPINDLY family)
MSELITKTYEEYENLAVFFASNKNISEIKHALKEKILISNLFNIDYFTKNIENIYCKIHKEHQ